MRILIVGVFVLASILAACAPGTGGVITPPPEVATAAAQAPTLGIQAATQASGAVNAAATEAARVASTVVPSAQTAAVPVQTAVATLVAPVAGSVTPVEGTVQVKLSDDKVDVPTVIRAGTVTFHVTNSGTAAHSFEIDTQGAKQTLSKELNPGDVGTLQVNLAPGAYVAYSPVDGDKDKGMSTNILVVP